MINQVKSIFDRCVNVGPFSQFTLDWFEEWCSIPDDELAGMSCTRARDIRDATCYRVANLIDVMDQEKNDFEIFMALKTILENLRIYDFDGACRTAPGVGGADGLDDAE